MRTLNHAMRRLSSMALAQASPPTHTRLARITPTYSRHSRSCITPPTCSRSVPHQQLFYTSSSSSSSSSQGKPGTESAPPTSTSTPNTGEALPAPQEGSSGGVVLDVSGEDGATVRLDDMGPLVVNADGTTGRVANWGEMTAMERETTLRLLKKRNKARLDALKAGDGDGASSSGD